VAGIFWVCRVLCAEVVSATSSESFLVMNCTHPDWLKKQNPV